MCTGKLLETYRATFLSKLYTLFKIFLMKLALQEVFRCLKWCFYFSFSFIEAIHMMHIVIEVIANKSSLRVTSSNIIISKHHYNFAFVDENVDTKKLSIVPVENVVTNRVLIILLKRWQLYMYDKRKWFAFFKITLTLSFHPYHLCGSNNEYDHLFILFNYPYTFLEIVKWCYYIMQL